MIKNRMNPIALQKPGRLLTEIVTHHNLSNVLPHLLEKQFIHVENLRINVLCDNLPLIVQYHHVYIHNYKSLYVVLQTKHHLNNHIQYLFTT